MMPAGRWVRRAAGAAVLAVVFMATGLQGAAADPSGGPDTAPVVAPFLSEWITLQDSRGIPLWNHEVSIDHGGLTSPGKVIWASLVEIAWNLYTYVAALALWGLDWALSLKWLQLIAAPAIAVGDALQQVVSSLGVVPTFMTITALAAGLLMLRGFHSTAVWEFAAVAVIAALASGVFAQPVRMVAGPDGYVAKASQTGQEVAASLAFDDAEGLSAEQNRKRQQGQLVDVFIRQPAQMVAFGRLIDGTDCESVYDQVVKKGPYGTSDDIREAVGDCNEAAGKYAANPSAGMATSAMLVAPAGLIVLALAVVLGGSVIVAGIWAVFQSIKALITLIIGLLPGGARGSLLLTFTEILVSLGLIVVTSVFLTVFLNLITAVFAASNRPARTFIIVDILMIAGIVVYLRMRRSSRGVARSLAQRLGWRPSGGKQAPGPTQIPVAQGLAAGAVAGAAAGSWRAHRLRKAITDTQAPALLPTASASGGVGLPAAAAAVVGGSGGSGGPADPSSTSDGGTPPGGGSGSGGQPPPSPTASGTGQPAPTASAGTAGPPASTTGQASTSPAVPERSRPAGSGPARRWGQRAATVGAIAVAAAVTGGTSAAAAATKAGSMARTARRAQLTARLAAAGARAGKAAAVSPPGRSPRTVTVPPAGLAPTVTHRPAAPRTTSAGSQTAPSARHEIQPPASKSVPRTENTAARRAQAAAARRATTDPDPARPAAATPPHPVSNPGSSTPSPARTTPPRASTAARLNARLAARGRTPSKGR